MPVSKNRRKNNKVKKSRTPDQTPAFDQRAVEEMILQIVGDAIPEDLLADEDDDPLWRAQDLMYQAWEARTKRERIALARKALKISDLCADAHVLLAEEAAKNLVEMREFYERGLAAGERALGPEAFEEDVGHFWGLLDTRPYMRARIGLAETLWQLGERGAAIDHVQDMLRLNPGDNQGVRYRLASWFLTTGDHDALKELLGAYDDDGSAEWTYATALLAFRENGKTKAAKSALKAAWNSNAHVPDFLLRTKQMPKRLPGFYALGSEDEAVLYVLDNLDNWSSTPGALEWLADITRNLVPPSRDLG